MTGFRQGGVSSDSWAVTAANSVFDETAIAAVREALARRMDVKNLFENEADVDLLIKMSGGCIRDLMHLITLAFEYVGESPRFTSEAVQKAIRRMRATYVRRLTDDDYVRLAAIARREAAPRDKQTGRLLFHRFALEYLDENNEPWIDIHPLVVEMEKFRRVLASHSLITDR